MVSYMEKLFEQLKNIDLANYLDATGFEALIGYLYLSNDIITKK